MTKKYFYVFIGLIFLSGSSQTIMNVDSVNIDEKKVIELADANLELVPATITSIPTGRGIGIIDVLRLINVALGVELLQKDGLLAGRDGKVLRKIQRKIMRTRQI